eukprot:gene1360-1558_t
MKILYFKRSTIDNATSDPNHYHIALEYPASLPSTLTYLRIDNSHDTTIISQGFLPPTLLTFNVNEFKQPITEGLFPSSLLRLTINTGFNHPIIPGSIPSLVTHLFLGNSFRQPLVIGSIPSSVTHFRMHLLSTQTITPGALPLSLTHLFIGCAPDSRPLLPGSLPPSLQHLTLGSNFNQPISPDLLPQSLKFLTFHNYFNVEFLPDCLPSSLEYLALGENYRKIFQVGSLPSSLKQLRFPIKNGGYQYDIQAGVLPSTLTHLDLGLKFPKSPLPSSITHLMLRLITDITPDDLPPSITHLELGQTIDDLDFPRGTLPSSLTHLIIRQDYWHPSIFIQFHDPSVPPTLFIDRSEYKADRRARVLNPPSSSEGWRINPFNGDTDKPTDWTFIQRLLNNKHLFSCLEPRDHSVVEWKKIERDAR